jgi:hypothetical protein
VLVHTLVIGFNARATADTASKLKGVEKVLLADSAPYEHQLAELTAASCPRHQQGQERDTGLRHHQDDVARHLRATDLSRNTNQTVPDTNAKPAGAS